MTTPVEEARRVADTVLYEGYVLYPYRAGAGKNQVRWQWGVLMPHDVVAFDASERAANRTDLVVDGDPTALRATVRFLQVQHRRVEDATGRPVERLEVQCTDPLAIIDIPNLLNEIGDSLESTQRDGDRIVFVIEKMQAATT